MEKMRRIIDMETYLRYCNWYESLVMNCIEKGEDDAENNDAATLWLLIEDYEERTEFIKPKNFDPVEYLELIMKNKNLNASGLAREIGVGISLISQILNYKKGFSINIIRKISERFKVNAEVFLKSYDLKNNFEAA
jgi:HTH-type transcriptional regulator/antitoxin HigA